MSEQRITELELRYTLQQDLLQQLSDLLLEHGREIDRLRREVELLRSSQRESSSLGIVDEKPPHY